MSRILKRDSLPDGKWVSTVELDCSDPRIVLCDEAAKLLNADGATLPVGGRFETMVFPQPSNFAEIDVRQYETEEEALAGHDELVARWRTPQ